MTNIPLMIFPAINLHLGGFSLGLPIAMFDYRRVFLGAISHFWTDPRLTVRGSRLSKSKAMAAMVRIQVELLSGEGASLEVTPDMTIGQLKEEVKVSNVQKLG